MILFLLFYMELHALLKSITLAILSFSQMWSKTKVPITYCAPKNFRTITDF